MLVLRRWRIGMRRVASATRDRRLMINGFIICYVKGAFLLNRPMILQFKIVVTLFEIFEGGEVLCRTREYRAWRMRINTERPSQEFLQACANSSTRCATARRVAVALPRNLRRIGASSPSRHDGLQYWKWLRPLSNREKRFSTDFC